MHPSTLVIAMMELNPHILAHRLRMSEKMKSQLEKARNRLTRITNNSPASANNSIPDEVRKESDNLVKSRVDYPRNQKCYCGSGKKFKHCCLYVKRTDTK